MHSTVFSPTLPLLHGLRSVSVCLLPAFGGKIYFGHKTWKRIRTHSGCKKPIKFAPGVCVGSETWNNFNSLDHKNRTNSKSNSTKSFNANIQICEQQQRHQRRRRRWRRTKNINIWSNKPQNQCSLRPRLNEACLWRQTHTLTHKPHTHSAQSVHWHSSAYKFWAFSKSICQRRRKTRALCTKY